MTTFRWLHVTDLHWGSDDHKDLWGSIQPHWFADIDRLQQKSGGPWDAVFFTGDLVNRGTKEEFAALTERLHDLFKHLKSKGSEPYLMVVPGNHDLQRPDAKSAGCKLLTKLWADDEDTQNAIWRKDTSSDAWKVVQKAFKNFTSWYTQVAKPFSIPSGVTPGLLPGEFAVTLGKGTYKIGVLGLNTAFLQLAEGDFKGKLETHPAQIVTACGMLHQQWVEEHHACLLLTHHPVDWLSKQGQSAFNGVIAPSGRFALHLCGHNHESTMLEMLMGGATSSRRLLCGRAIFGMDPYTDWEGKNQKARTHGYSAGSIDFSPPHPVLRIWPRRMDKKGDGLWGFNQDTYFHLEEDESIKPIHFEPTRKSPAEVIAEGKNTVSEIKQLDFVKPEWVDIMGEDSYGIYADFSVKGVIQRMRWIKPGRFLMGSPDYEKERHRDETPHDVILPHGFWLADTACTQELWEVLMDGNPSHFKGPQRPIEYISWNDCQAFMQKIKHLKPSLELCLPSEAQWEYACRAGTTTPFSFGENISLGLVNYNGNYPYAGLKKGRYREQTVEVKSLPCNKWGLYQMHGNVWEWCADWYGAYAVNGNKVEPTGPVTGGYRVCRGGSWIGSGGDVRSANRGRMRSVDWDNALSFRFSQVVKR